MTEPRIERIRPLDVTVDGVGMHGITLETPARTFERTVIEVQGEGTVGLGEDVTPDNDAQRRLRADGVTLPSGRTTVGELMEAFEGGGITLPSDPDGGLSPHLRWALESAILDLGLKQAGQSLGELLDRTYDPVRFVASPSLGDPPELTSVRRLRERVPAVEFKVDVPADPSDALLDELAETDAVRVLDVKGQYGPDVGAPADPSLYRRLLERFPNAILEDPAVTDATRPVLAAYRDRISWDAPISSVDAIETLPWAPSVLNLKPSRSGSIAQLFEILAYANAHDLTLYGGGMFELGPGRAHLHALASLCYPDGPNDIAPVEYHYSQSGTPLPTSPLHPPPSPAGIGWHTTATEEPES